MQIIAQSNGWTVDLDANGIVTIREEGHPRICIHDSAYEAIKSEVKDPAVRAELLRQWAATR